MTLAQQILDDLIAQTEATGYVVLTTMDMVLLETAYANTQVHVETVPKAEDYAFYKRCQVAERIDQGA